MFTCKDIKWRSSLARASASKPARLLHPVQHWSDASPPAASQLPGRFDTMGSAPLQTLRGASRNVSSSSGRALISVSDKTGLSELAQGLHKQGYEIVSTGGSAAAVAASDVPVTAVDALTGFPEMLDGRVKTLHPAVHGGILARRDVPAHMSALEQHNIGPIDVVIVNLYPFRATVTGSTAPSYDMGVENIDIGGPAMIRAAAKNHANVTVIVDPNDYAALLQNLEDGASDAFRKRCAWKAFQVAEWLWQQNGEGPPPELSLPMTLASSLRYGENPHQGAAFYTDSSLAEAGRGGVATAVQHHGKEMSYNNYLDADAAYGTVCDFPEPTCVIVKHTNPCGVATRTDDLLEAYRLAVRADPISAFGGIVAFNRPVTEALATELRQFRSPTDGETRMFYEIVIAPSYTPEGLEMLKGKSKTLRILEAAARAPSGRSLRQVAAGWLYQDADSLTPEELEFTVVSSAQPTQDQLRDLKFAWRCVKHVKSNAITVAKEERLLGMGSGQPNRVKSTEIALEKVAYSRATVDSHVANFSVRGHSEASQAADDVVGACLASDAFFPFSWNDSVEMACKAGIAAIAQPGGSMRDTEAIECCDKYGVVLVMTGHRHFKH